jgi:hypothetical protein
MAEPNDVPGTSPDTAGDPHPFEDGPGSVAPTTRPSSTVPPGQPDVGQTPFSQAGVGLAGRYEVVGAVLRGHDRTLGRDLAIKVLLEKHADRPEVVQRFREEAQVGGQLQHPAVVPVYDLGLSAEGRPYFTMKLVKGVTLAALLRQRPDPLSERPRFLGIVLQVCQAMAYGKAIDLQPDSHEAYNNLGHALLNQKKYVDAERLSVSPSTANPTTPWRTPTSASPCSPRGSSWRRPPPPAARPTSPPCSRRPKKSRDDMTV